MKNILVPTDFSPCSAVAYNYAALLAEKTGATINLLHVLDVPYSTQATTGSTSTETRGDLFYMMQLMKLTKSRMKKIRNSKIFIEKNVTDNIVIGQVPEKIAEAIKKFKIDLVVMGTHGLNGLQEKFIGSNAERIVRNAEVPVLTVKHEVKNLEIEKIVLATDFTKETDLILPAVSNIADILGAKLILAKIITLNDFESTRETEILIERFKEKNELKNYTTQTYYAYSREEGIRSIAGTIDADMIAMGTHGRHGLAHLFKGSIAEEVVNHSSLPVLTINFHKKIMEKNINGQKKKGVKTESDWELQIPSI